MESVTLLKDKHIVLAVTGSIAVYKSIDLASKLTQAGALVDVILTEAAQKFVQPLVFEAVTGRPVYTGLWDGGGSDGLPTHIAHIGLGESADVILVSPATANTISRLATGVADDLLTVTALSARCAIMVAPAMDGGMYQHPAVQANLDTLRERGVYIVDPETGRFASGMVGQGRLPETTHLLGKLRCVLGRHGVLGGKRVLVTAGGTREAIDPVRYVTNRSSGKQGYALAEAARDAGAEVVLVSAARGLPEPVGVSVHYVNTAEQMRDTVMNYVDRADVLMMAAAVADYRPAQAAQQKIKKQGDDEGLSLTLTRTPDILLDVQAARKETDMPRVVVGFAAESENLLKNAQKKLEKKGLDLLVANDITALDAGFGSDDNRVTLLQRDEEPQPLELQSKSHVAETVVQRVAKLLHG